MITIIDVMRSMRLECEPNVAWSIGARVRDLYERKYGHLPVKELRPKTNDGGTHCFAIYPDSMRDEIELIILSHLTQAARQGDLFASVQLLVDPGPDE